MYPERELRTLALNKARLRRRLGRQRDACLGAAGELAKPIAWLDEARTRWRKVSPLIKLSGVALGILARGPIFDGARRMTRWVRWGLSAFSLFRGLQAMKS